MVVAIRSIIPKKLDDKAMNEQWIKELDTFGKFLVRDFEQTVNPWHGDKPIFVLVKRWTSTGITLSVRVTGSEKAKNKWKWREYGTKPHKIRRKNAKTLAFPSVYHRGSRPGVRFVVASSSAGPTVYAPEVDHPGTEARKIGAQIAKDEQPVYEKWMEAAAYRVAQASGHAIK